MTVLNTFGLCAATALLGGTAMAADTTADAAREILRIERASMDGWLKGDPDPMLASLDPEITYIHVMTEKRLEGLAAVKALVEQYRGTPLFDSYEMQQAKVVVSGNLALLTYQLVRHNGSTVSRWNGTQVYEKKSAGWKVIHTHWSAPQ
ncbi:MAG: nuclear transport factor 2 family protein [Acidobacteriia bacterium]|nr:nuclear transport factor 2 family protein [Terriglobia bacterium]